MSIKGNWRRHGSEVIIRWCQRSFSRLLATRYYPLVPKVFFSPLRDSLLSVGAKGLSRRFVTRLRGFAAQFCRPQREKKPLAPGVPVPGGMHEKCKLSFLTDFDKCIKEHKIPLELVLMQSRPQVHMRL